MLLGGAQRQHGNDALDQPTGAPVSKITRRVVGPVTRRQLHGGATTAIIDAMPRAPQSLAADTAFFQWDGDVLVLNVLGKPAASKDAIGKPFGKQLKISVTAQPQHGKATDHMVRFLAPLFGVRVSDIEVVYGRESIHKQLRIKAPKQLPTVFGDGTLPP